MEDKAENWDPNMRTLRALLNLFGFFDGYRKMRKINRTERYGYISGVTKEDQSDRRSTLRKKG